MSFEAGGDVHPVPENVVALNDNLTEIDAHAELNTPLRR